MRFRIINEIQKIQKKKSINKSLFKEYTQTILDRLWGGECVGARAKKRRAGWPPPSAEPKSEAAPAADACAILVY